MKRSIPWVLFAVALIAFGASFSELQRMRARFGEATRHQFHDHQDVRQFMIRFAMADLDHPIIVLGDSITEMAKFPAEIESYPIVNAGIGGATIGDFVGIAPKLLDGITPAMIVVALGANDVGSNTIREEYAALLSDLKRRCPNVLAVAVTPLDGAQAVNSQIAAAAKAESVRVIDTHLAKEMIADHIHPSPEGSKQWSAAIVAEMIFRPRA
jgi:hypothetical protein